MATPVTMPQLGESVTEGTIVRWLRTEGDTVAEDEPLAEIDTDKVSAELPSPFAGRVERLLVSEGETVDVGVEIALIAVARRTSSPAGPSGPPRERAGSEGPTEEWPAAGTKAQPAAAISGESPSAAARGGGDSSANGSVRTEPESAEQLRLRRSSPVVRRLAAEHGVDLSDIAGTGTGGRVTKKDIVGYIERAGAGREAVTEAPPALPPPPRRTQPAPERAPAYEGDRVVALTSIRRTIAERMSTSKREAPHAWTMVEADVTGLVALRERERASFYEREAVRLTYLPFIVRAVAESLKENPVLNSVWDGDRILLRKRINIGIAVDLEDALIVPVIKNADELNITGLARRIHDVIRRGRDRRLGTGDVSGGTFTVNNPGALGSVVSTPIINHPQAAILSAEAVVKRPVVVEGPAGDSIAIRSMMNLEVSFDHRVLDGGAALRFLDAVRRRLEGYTAQSSLG